jgi:hypothetical protein
MKMRAQYVLRTAQLRFQFRTASRERGAQRKKCEYRCHYFSIIFFKFLRPQINSSNLLSPQILYNLRKTIG